MTLGYPFICAQVIILLGTTKVVSVYHQWTCRQCFCGIQILSDQTDDSDVDRLKRAAQGEKDMHDLLIALAFIGMVVAPAIVAAKSGAEAADELDD